MNIEIICPLYQAEKYIVQLHKSLQMQKKVDVLNILYLLTESKDDSEKFLKQEKLCYQFIKKEEFSHSLTREKYALKSKADIIVFISQDIVIEDDLWLYHLTKDIISGQVDAAFSRQITKYDTIEKYTRERNYPEESRIVSKEDIPRLGLYTFFFSDASSAIRTATFRQLGGYDKKNLPISEDMYFAYKLIMHGKKIKYAAESMIYHSHHFTLKQLYDRYRLTGNFFQENPYLNDYSATKAGGGLAKYVFKRMIQERNIKAIFRFFPDMMARYIGMKVGKYEKRKSS